MPELFIHAFSLPPFFSLYVCVNNKTICICKSKPFRLSCGYHTSLFLEYFSMHCWRTRICSYNCLHATFDLSFFLSHNSSRYCIWLVLFMSLNTCQYSEWGKLGLIKKKQGFVKESIEFSCRGGIVIKMGFTKSRAEITMCSLFHLELYRKQCIMFWNGVINFALSYQTKTSVFNFVSLILPPSSSWKISKNWSLLKNTTKIKQKIVLAKHIGLIKD